MTGRALTGSFVLMEIARAASFWIRRSSRCEFLSRLYGAIPPKVANLCLNKEAAISALTVAPGPEQPQPYRHEFGKHPL
jgi:hypothetical protein